MRISDWSSDVCSSDLFAPVPAMIGTRFFDSLTTRRMTSVCSSTLSVADSPVVPTATMPSVPSAICHSTSADRLSQSTAPSGNMRSEEHTSELQSLMRISYAVFCLQKKNKQNLHTI